MNVRVCGPNLWDQSKGTFHVHADGCRDLRNYGPGGKYGGDTDGPSEMLVENATVLAVVFEIYADQMAENPDAATEDFVSDFWFAPCCVNWLEYGEQPGESAEQEIVTPVYEVWVSETNNIGPASKSSFMKLTQDELQEKALWLVNQLSIGQHLHVVAHDENEYS